MGCDGSRYIGAAEVCATEWRKDTHATNSMTSTTRVRRMPMNASVLKYGERNIGSSSEDNINSIGPLQARAEAQYATLPPKEELAPTAPSCNSGRRPCR